MALTKTTLAGTTTAGTKQISLTAFTNPATGQISPKVMIQFATGEKCLMTDASLSPTLEVVRGYEGTSPIAHIAGEGIKYGLMSDSEWTQADSFVGQANVQIPNAIRFNTLQVTATGTTGSTAQALTSAPFLIVNTTGATDAGVRLWVPAVGDAVLVHNDSTTGAVKVYADLGATIAGASGATGQSITATGTQGALFACLTAAAWTIVIEAT